MQKIREMFNLRLYIEGLKKIKLIGIAALIVTVALCAIVPIIYIADGQGHRESVNSISISQFAMPLGIIMAFAPFFISSMFSYLNVRRDSDFYHAIPYKRQTVFSSFLLAAMTWCLGIITAAVLACAVLWSLAPLTAFELYYVPLLIAAAFCSCLMLMAFMALAMSLTGTATTNIFIFGLVACFFRAVCLLFTNALDNTVYILDLSDTFLRFTNISFFFPIAFLGGSFSLLEPRYVYTNIPLYIYTVAVSVGMLLLALWLYVRRRSEIATRSAPTKRLQHVYRIAFTTPFVLLMFTFIAIELLGDDSMDASFYIFMCFVIGIVYFLYELITTKSPKNMIKSAPYLVVLLIIGCTFVGVIGLIRTSVLSSVYDKEQIQSVTFDNRSSNIYTADNSYETIKTGDIKVSDPEVIGYVADALRFSIDSVNDGTYSRNRVLAGVEGGKEVYERYQYVNVTIKLKDGRTIGRKLKFSESEYAKMLSAAQNTEEYSLAYLEIPEPESIYSINNYRIDGQRMRFVYETFYEEYMGLTDEQKLAVKSLDQSRLRYQIECYGRENFSEFCFDMKISHLTPKTLNVFAAGMTELLVQNPSAAEDGELRSLDAAKKLVQLYADTDGKFFVTSANDSVTSSFNLSLALFDRDGQSVGSFYVDGRTDGRAKRGVKYLCEALSDGSVRTRYTEGDFIITLDVYYYRHDMNVQNTSNDKYDGVTVHDIHVSTQLVLFCDSETAQRIEMYIDKDELYYYYDDDIAVKVDYYG